MKRLVDRGCDFRCNDSVSLGVDQRDPCRAVQLAQVFGGRTCCEPRACLYALYAVSI